MSIDEERKVKGTINKNVQVAFDLKFDNDELLR